MVLLFNYQRAQRIGGRRANELLNVIQKNLISQRFMAICVSNQSPPEAKQILRTKTLLSKCGVNGEVHD
jgi:hypothetical protein